MKKYNSYCYETINDVASSISSNFFIGDGQVVTGTAVSGSSIIVSAQSKNQTYNYTVTPPDCDSLGYDNTFFGVTVPDVMELWAGTTLLLVTVYVIKILKRAS